MFSFLFLQGFSSLAYCVSRPSLLKPLALGLSCPRQVQNSPAIADTHGLLLLNID
jgi:hypothetical protein